eukprot:scaffold8353_cov138-Cylindrotheca_fusiformis.AAC.40
MGSSTVRILNVLLTLFTLHIAEGFSIQPTPVRQNTALMAGGRKRKAVKRIFQKIINRNQNSSTRSSWAVVSDAAMARASQNSEKYGEIEDVGERAFQILLDLGLVERSK